MATTRSIEFMLDNFNFASYGSYRKAMRAFLLQACATSPDSAERILCEVALMNKRIYEGLCKNVLHKQYQAEHSPKDPLSQLL